MPSPPQPDSATSEINRRPADVTSLLVEGETHDLWFGANRTSNRFFITNIERVLGDLAVNHTTMAALFGKASRVISEQTSWPDQYGFDYISSPTQLFPKERSSAKWFGKAATVIVALELYAAERKPAYNVYDHLRILPAQYFVDQLDKSKVSELKALFAQMTVAQKQERFGEKSERPITEIIHQAIAQPYATDLLEKHAYGHTVFKSVATKLHEFLRTHFPELVIGDVLSAGQERAMQHLGTKNAVPSMRSPQKTEVQALRTED